MNTDRNPLRTRLAAVAGVVLMTSGLTLATAPAANAATAPACLHTKVDRGFVWHTVTVTNKCTSGAKRVKVIWNKAPDGQCTTVKKGKSFTDRSPIGTFDGLKTC